MRGWFNRIFFFFLKKLFQKSFYSCSMNGNVNNIHWMLLIFPCSFFNFQLLRIYSSFQHTIYSLTHMAGFNRNKLNIRLTKDLPVIKKEKEKEKNENQLWNRWRKYLSGNSMNLCKYCMRIVFHIYRSVNMNEM